MAELLTLEEYLNRKQQRPQKPSLVSKEYLKKKGKDISGERLTEKEYLSKKQARKKPEREPRKIKWYPFREKLQSLAKQLAKEKPIDKEKFKATWGFEPIQDLLKEKPYPEAWKGSPTYMKSIGAPEAPEELEIKKPYPKTFVDRIKEVISKPFIRTPEQEIARSQNIYAISKELDLPLTTVRKNYNQLTREMRDYPTSPELLGGMLILPIMAGLMLHPATTILRVSGFMALSEIESAVISKVKGEPYKFLQHKGLKDLLPEEVNQYTRDTVEVLDFVGKALVLGGIKMKAPRIAEKFTKNVITEYKMPKKVYISPKKVSSIFKTGKEISPQELELIKDLGLSGKRYKVATMKGIAIEVPAEKIVTIADKPYFSKIKHLFRLKPSKEVRTFRAGKPIEVIPEERLLPAPTRKITPPIARVPKPSITQRKALLEIKSIMPRIKELSTHITASKSIGEEIEPEVYTELEKLNSKISELQKIAYPPTPEEVVFTKAKPIEAKPEVPTRVPLNIITEEQATAELNQRRVGLKFPGETEQEVEGRIKALEFYAKPTAEEIELPPRIEKPEVIKVEEVKPGAPRGWKLIQDTQLLKRYKTEEGTLEIDIAQTLSKDGLRKFIFKIKKIGRKTEIRARNLEEAIEKYKLKTGAVEVYEGEELRILKGYEINRVLEDLEMTAGMEASDNWIKSSIESVVGTLSEKEMSGAIKDIKEAIKSTPPEVYTFPKIPRPTPEVTPTEKIDKVKRSEIVKYISEKLGVPIRIGRFRERAWGIYKRAPKIARIKAPTDVRTASHEIGHYIYEELKPLEKTKIAPSLVPKYAEELASFLIDFPELKRTPREAFSEFVSAYITDPVRAKNVAPTLYTYFENFISNYPKIQMVLNTAQQDYQRWVRLPATAKILSHISPTPEKTSIATLGRLYALSIDELYPLKKCVDIIKKKGIKVLEQDDPFILATAHRGWHGKADAFLRHKTFDINYNWAGKSLQDIYKPIDEAKALDDFDAFLVAKRSLELKKRGIETGIEPQDARKAISELVKKYRFFEEKAEELYQYQTDLLKYAVDSELMTPEAYTKMRMLNKCYVPFYRVMELTGSKGLLGRGVVNLREIFKQIRGSQREIIRPSESIVKNTYTIIDAAERNQVATALVKLAEMYPKDLGRLVEKIPPAMVKLAGVSLEKDFGITTDEPGETLKQVIDIFRPSILTPSENIIRVMRKGKRSYYQVDPDLYKSLAATDRESVNMLIKILSYPARWLRLGAVALSPEFIVRNPVRDAFTAMVYSKGGFIPGFDTLRGLWSVVKHDKLYWKWKISGAEHSALVSLDRKYLQKNIRDLISTWSKKLANVIRHPAEHARILAELGEEATRIGEYRLVLGGGRRWFLAAEKVPEGLPLKSRMLRAGIAARQVTLDFSRLGAKTKAVNSIIAFWNANVQDLDKIARAFKDHPFRILYKVIAGITIPSILLYLANKDDARVEEVPQWQKDIFWIVTTKHMTRERWDKMDAEKRSIFVKKYPIFRLPKPFTLGILFGTLPERMLDYAYKEDPESFKGLSKTVGKAINPGVVPTALLAPTEALTNYSFFLDRPIEPMGTQKLFPEQRYTQYTTETAKLLGKTLKISPSKIEYFLRGYWGALGKMGLETLDLILRSVKLVPKPKGPTPSLADIPLVRGFVVREPVGSVSEALNEFYELYEKSQMSEATIKDLIKKKDKQLANKYKTKYPEYRVAKDFRIAGKRLSDLRKERIKIWESDKLTRERKREKILEIERTMTRIARRLLNRYRELIKKR